MKERRLKLEVSRESSHRSGTQGLNVATGTHTPPEQRGTGQ